MREQLTLTAASTMILAATSVLTLRAASALTLPEGLFNLDEMLERMSEFSRDRFWLRRDDGMMTSRVEREKATRMLALWNVWTASYLPIWSISLTKQTFKTWWYIMIARISRMSEFNSKFERKSATIAMSRIQYLSAHANSRQLINKKSSIFKATTLSTLILNLRYHTTCTAWKMYSANALSLL